MLNKAIRPNNKTLLNICMVSILSFAFYISFRLNTEESLRY